MATITPNFKLKNSLSKTPTLIYLKLYYNKVRFIYSTGLSIKPELWVNEENRPYLKNTEPGLTVTMSKTDISQAAIIDNELNRFKTETARIFDHFSYQNTQPTNELLKAEYDKVFRPNAPEKKPKELNLNQYIEKFISDIKIGKRTIPGKGTQYTKGTIKTYLGFQVQFNNYQTESRNLSFEQITIDFYDKFLAFFNKKNYSPNTIGRHIKSLKSIMKAAGEDGLHQNKDIERKKFKAISTEVHPIYLTQKEVETLYDLDLSDNKPFDIARDIFLIGCYTAQRYSDYSRINSQNIKEVRGVKVIDMKQKKTGAQVIIPIRPELEAILKKYDYNPPRLHEDNANTLIKKVCDKAKINEQIVIENIRGGLKVVQSKAKHELIMTHTARRTGATLMYLSGIPTIAAMSITGHKTESQYLKYIRVTKEENAQTLSIHPYFKGTPLKLVK